MSPDPEIEFPKRKVPVSRREKLVRKPSPPADLKVKEEKVSQSEVPKRKPVKKEKRVLPEVRVSSPDFDLDFPKRKAAVVKTEARPATYKKTIFKSRSKPNLEKPAILDNKSSQKDAILEPPRVPPVSDHFVDIPRSKPSKTPAININQILEEDDFPVRTSKRKKVEIRDPVVEKLKVEKSEFSLAELTTPDLTSSQETLPPPSPANLYSIELPEGDDDMDFPARLPLKTASQPKPIAEGRGKKTFFKSKLSKPAGKASEFSLAEMSTPDLPSSQETLPPPSPGNLYSLEPLVDDDEMDFPARLPLKTASQPKPIAEGRGKKTFFKSKLGKPAGKALSLYRHNVGWAGEVKKPENKAESLDFNEEDEEEDRY